MEQCLQQWEKFASSAQCVFDLRPFDYPTVLQQRLILAHHELAQLLRTHTPPELTRLMQAQPERQAEVMVPGLLYTLMLEGDKARTLLESCLTGLRSDGWTGMERLLQQLLRESFGAIKMGHRVGLLAAVEQLLLLGQVSADLMTLLVKSMDSFDPSDLSLAYNNSLLQLLEQRVLPYPTLLLDLLADLLFYKLLRILALLPHEASSDYRARCVRMAMGLLEYDCARCLAMPCVVQRAVVELDQQESSAGLVQAVRDRLDRAKDGEGGEGRLAGVLPMRVETALTFVLREQASQMQVRLQLDWAFGRGQEQSDSLLLDLVRWLLWLDPKTSVSTQILYVLQWLLYRSCHSTQLLQFLKAELFHQCLCIRNCSPHPNAPFVPIRFLASLFSSNFDFAQTLLAFVLRDISNPQLVQKIGKLLKMSSQMYVLDVSKLIADGRLSGKLRADLRKVMGVEGAAVQQEWEEGEDSDPLSNLVVRKESEHSIQFSQSEEEIEEIKKEEKMDVEDRQDQSKLYLVRLQKQFHQDLGDALTALLEDPTLLTYKEFHKQLMEEIRNLKVGREETTIDNFISEAAKVTYLMFQAHFEDHKSVREDSVPLFLLSVIATDWRINSLQTQSAKKLLRKIIELFPTAEPAFWRYFLLNFRRTVYPQTRDMRDWLMSKEKQGVAVAVLRELGGLTREMVENAEQLRLSL